MGNEAVYGSELLRAIGVSQAVLEAGFFASDGDIPYTQVLVEKDLSPHFERVFVTLDGPGKRNEVFSIRIADDAEHSGDLVLL